MPEINTPSNPKYLLRKAMEKIEHHKAVTAAKAAAAHTPVVKAGPASLEPDVQEQPEVNPQTNSGPTAALAGPELYQHIGPVNGGLEANQVNMITLPRTPSPDMPMRTPSPPGAPRRQRRGRRGVRSVPPPLGLMRRRPAGLHQADTMMVLGSLPSPDAGGPGSRLRRSTRVAASSRG